MATKDLYEDLVRYYEFQIGNLPRREEFLTALRDAFSEEDLNIFFQLPYFGFIREKNSK